MQPKVGKKTSQFTGMPRSIRTRLLNPRKKAADKAPAATAPTHEQEVAMSMAGKTALGPWLGPFMPAGLGAGAAVAEPAAPARPMFVHYRGRVFSDLEGHAVEGLEEVELEPPNMSPVATSALPAIRKDRSKELALMSRKGMGKRHNDGAYAASPRANRRRMRALNQPRSGF